VSGNQICTTVSERCRIAPLQVFLRIGKQDHQVFVSVRFQLAPDVFGSSRLKAHRLSRSIIFNAVETYHRFALRLRDVENLLAERVVIVSCDGNRV
jgi:hypothetical protein